MDCLVPYSSSSESEEELKVNSKIELPSAHNLLKKIEKISGHEENPNLHKNRIRSFEHERGSWATYVFVPVSENLDELAAMCIEKLAAIADLDLCDDFHITLSRTVVLQYHLIDNFVKTLEKKLAVEENFIAFLGKLAVYINEEGTRTFVGFEVMSEKLLRLLEKVDIVMEAFHLQKFYKEPSFHISFAWCLGNKLNEIKSQLESLQCDLQTNYGDNKSIKIKELRCKIGHKVYEFNLNNYI